MADKETRQKLILGGLVVAVILYAGYTWVYSPRAEQLAGMEERLESLQTQNRTARILIEQGGEAAVEDRLTEYSDQLVRVEGLIPSAEELPDLLDAISTEARRTGVELSLIQPTGAAVAEFYTRRTYDLAVLGSYHQVGEFLTRVGSLPRIITPIDLNVTLQEGELRDGSPRLEARFAIETYVLPAPGEQLPAEGDELPEG
jgi:type IV pilus assembly protein PilO